jgi:hypothetical protein
MRMRPTGRVTATLLGATLVLTTALGASAQDPGATEAPFPICSLLTAQEVSDALGVVVSITNSWDVTCTYGADESSGELFSVSSNRDPETLTERRLVFTGDMIDVGGQEALYTAETTPILFVETPDGGTWTLLVLGTVPDGVDTKIAMSHLGEFALSRFAALDAMATAEPADTGLPLTGDAELEALFPTLIGSVPVIVDSISGADLQGIGEASAVLQAALEGAGKTLADVSIGVGYAADVTAGTVSSISAFRVKGADISTLKAAALPILARDQVIGPEVSREIAGKDVTEAAINGTQTLLYPRGDTLWMVTAVEPALTEVLRDLP